MAAFYHEPVLARETTGFLGVVENGLYVDCTLGGGGHAQEILERGGCVVGLDRDPEAIRAAGKRLAGYGRRFRAHTARFSGMDEVDGLDPVSVDGIVMDLGVSSAMIDNSERGFSYRQDGPLDMRMGRDGESARDVIASRNERDLARIFKEYGEERYANRIARAVVEERSRHNIATTGELAGIIERVVRRMPHKSMARVFQALRIEVNDELGELTAGLEHAVDLLRPGGRLCVISYHSLEDRMVKSFLREKADPCICPPGLPVCRCGRAPVMRVVTRKPVEASEDEISRNSRARSARLRVGEKLPEQRSADEIAT